MTAVYGETIDLGEGLLGRIFDSHSIPPLTGCRLTLSDSVERPFFLEPGHIHIGDFRPATKQLSLVLLRYGIEWQIWHRAVSDQRRQSIVDLAAARTAALFASMLSSGQRESLRRSATVEFRRVLSIFGSDNLEAALSRIGERDFDCLSRFHKSGRPNYDFGRTERDIVNYLAQPTEHLFTRGGDVRLRLDEKTLLNVYGCQPFPRPAAYTFASSTATSVSDYSYLRSEEQRQRLIGECVSATSLRPIYRLPRESVREFKKLFGLSRSRCELILCPSGTDAQLICAAIISSVFGHPATNIVIASDETGSGTPLAVTGRHFSSITGLDVPTEKEELLDGMVEQGLLNIPIRHNDGSLKTAQQIDDDVERAVEQVLRERKRPVLHVMDQSKLGCWAPTSRCLDGIVARVGDAVTIVVDACQMRLDPVDLRGYLDQGFVVLVTGSKFFTGPPFSGGVLIPNALLERNDVRPGRMPEGLGDYVSEHEWPDLVSLRATLGKTLNLGANLRWHAALAEMARFGEVPEELQLLGIDTFCRAVERILKNTPYLEPVFSPDSDQYKRTGIGEVLSSRRTIYPFYVLSPTEGRVLRFAKTRRLYELLNSDLSNADIDACDSSRRILGQACHIGQPVRVVHPTEKDSAVLRISAGARLISESWQDESRSGFLANIDREIAQIETIVAKIGILVNHPRILDGT